MGRIVGFLGATTGAGATTICCELAKSIAKRDYKVCVFDFYFAMNDLSLKLKDDFSFDLKDFLIGKVDYDAILELVNDNLYLIKSNAYRFNYLSYKKDIENLIKVLSLKFDYVLIDINSFDFKNLSFSLSVVNELFIIFENELNSIRMAARFLNFARETRAIDNINLVFNKSKIIGQINKKFFGRKDIESLLNNDVFFEFPKFYKNNKKYASKKLISEKLIEKFCSSFIANKILHINYAREYKGLIGRIKKKIYAKFE